MFPDRLKYFVIILVIELSPSIVRLSQHVNIEGLKLPIRLSITSESS